MMRKVLLLVLWAWTAGGLMAREEPGIPKEAPSALPGVALAEGITEITGVAISPMLGVSGVGAWRYFQTPAEARAGLPWFCQPWAWGTGFVILALCFMKDTVGAAAPGILKKPFDMAELFENKASALVASAAFVPLIAREMAVPLEKLEVPAAGIGLELAAGIDPSWILVPCSVAAFLVVWVCSHAVNVSIILSPFSLVDTALKLMRAGVLAVVAASYWITPWLGAAICVAIIAVAAWFAPSALRLMIFGTRFAGDLLLPWRAKRKVTPASPQVFTMGRVAGLPARTGGRLVLAAEGAVEFRYRPWCVMMERRVMLPGGVRHVEKGLLSPTLVSGEEKLMVLLPRYRGHEPSIVEQLKLAGTREHRWRRNWTAVRTWLAGVFGGRRLAG